MGWWRFGGDRFAAFFGGVLLVFFLVAVTAQWITPYDPYAVNLRNAFSPPSLTHPFGTDQFGRDVASRTILATRVTTRITASALLMALATGIPLGMLAGYVGGKAEAPGDAGNGHPPHLSAHSSGDYRHGGDRA